MFLGNANMCLCNIQYKKSGLFLHSETVHQYNPQNPNDHGWFRKQTPTQTSCVQKIVNLTSEPAGGGLERPSFLCCSLTVVCSQLRHELTATVSSCLQLPEYCGVTRRTKISARTTSEVSEVGQSLCDHNSQRLGVMFKQNKLTSFKTAGCCLAAAVLLFHLLVAAASRGSLDSTD